MVFMPSHLLCTFAIKCQSALVVDIGFKETEVLPVSYFVLVFIYVECANMAREGGMPYIVMGCYFLTVD